MNDTFRMKKQILPLTIALVLSAMTMEANAQVYAYWQDQNGEMIRSGTGTCVRTGNWTPELATAECDPELVPAKVAVAEPVPEVRPEPEPQPVVEAKPMPVTEKVSMEADALFDFDRAEIKPQGKQALNEMIDKLKLAGAELGPIVTTGHTDSIGSSEYNLELSLRRAEAVKAYLVTKGIDDKDIKTAGVGEKQPFANNKTAQGRAENRRVEIEVSGTRTTTPTTP